MSLCCAVLTSCPPMPYYYNPHNLYCHSTGGLKWGRDNVKNFFVNTCTYYSKGVADYVGVWDFDEFFQPRGTNRDLLDVINAMEPEDGPVKYFYPPDAIAATLTAKDYVPRRGMADKDGHPFCYLILKSEVTLFEREEGKEISLVRTYSLF